jgi:hypothetical protein
LERSDRMNDKSSIFIIGAAGTVGSERKFF